MKKVCSFYGIKGFGKKTVAIVALSLTIKLESILLNFKWHLSNIYGLIGDRDDLYFDMTTFKGLCLCP